MSDIKKLQEVINSLEEQSSRVSEFNGVLSAIDSAKSDIFLAKTEFEELAEEHKKAVAENCIRFDELGDRINELEQKISTIESKMLTESQYDVGRDKILLRISDLRFVSTEQFDRGVKESEKSVISSLSQTNSMLEGLLAKQEKSIQSLRIFVFSGIILSISTFLLLIKGVLL
ncbi:hypothetical protein [Marinobacterium weihaiense]|uniref:Uncharacterized protein n=1 Tax=Marinobacterium weihaiense TaxID=2851016 RepID=A0ABS6MD02_9GAMM|nr:hypothetical protein [Marinobacterium weihaiense]MBV0934183.1 hypothetical protein [Marinobacterium weihaiense]